MKPASTKSILRKASRLAGLMLLSASSLHSQSFTHPGALSTQADLDRMAAKVAAGAQPWKSSWDILVGNTNGFLSHNSQAVETVIAGNSSEGGENYIRLARDCAKAYQCALRYHGSGDTRFADKAVYFMNSWASTHTRWSGDSNLSLRAGLYGYQFATAAELMRNYSGWAAADFAAFQAYLINEFYHFNGPFLDTHNGTCDTHYWANWDLASLASTMAIGVVCDNQALFDKALNYFYTGVGTANINRSVHYIHPNGLGQWQESGRDQGHTLMGPMLLGAICEIAWNQGIDLYGEMNNRFLASVEYISKYNTGHDVPFRPWINCDGWFQSTVSSTGRGSIRPGWDLVYNHYVNRMGLSAPYTRKYADMVGPEGGGFNFGTASWGFDSLGFTTLTHSRDPIAAGAVPSALRPTQQDWQVTLSWAGSAHATSYNVKRSTTSGGPYTSIATVGSDNLFYVDPGLTAGTIYYYVVSANNADGESANSAEASVIAVAAGGNAIQAENANRGGGASLITWTSGHHGTGSVVPNTGGYIEFTGVDGGAGGPATLAIRYALGNSTRTGTLTVNGISQDFTAVATGNWDFWDEYLVTVPLNSGTSNTIRIESDGSDNFVYIDEITVKNSTTSPTATLPAAPGSLSATLNTSQVNLSWNSVSNATSYNIKRAISSGGPYVVLDNLTGTSFSDANVSHSGTTYYYVVTALNSAGESVGSNEGSAFTLPTNLAATGGDNTVTLDWDDSAPGSDLAYFNVWRSTNPGGPYTQVATGVGSSAHTDNTATNGAAYYYAVTAVNAGGAESAYSNEAWAISAPVCHEIDGVLSMEAENGVVGSRWTIGSDTSASNDAYVEVDPAYNWTGTSPEGTTPDHLVVYNLSVSTSGNYRFWFRSYSGNGADDSFFWRIDKGGWNLENDRYGVGSWFSTDNTQVDNLGTGNHVLEIAYRENGARLDKFVVQLDSLTAPSGDGPPESTTVPFPSEPTGLGATAASPNQINLSWSASASADSYNVKRSTNSGGPFTTVAPGITATTFNDSGLSANTTYYYVVSAVNARGESASSSQASATTQASGGGLVTQAEGASYGGGAVIGSSNSGYNGTGYVNLPTSGGYVEFTGIDGGAGGLLLLDIRYALGTAARTGLLIVNGVSQDITVASTGSWTDYATHTVTVTLNSGTNNTIRIQSNGQDFGNVDDITVKALPVFLENNGVLSMEAESGALGVRWQIGTDASASNDAYMEINPLYNWTGASPEGTSSEYLVDYKFNISTSGNYRFWFRIHSGNAADDSFFWRIDGGAWNLENDRYGVGSWFSKDHTQVDTLGPGEHTLQISYRENGTRLDKFVIQLDSLTAPSGDGPLESATGPSVINYGTYTLTARHSGKALEVADSSTANGANVQQSALTGGANQRWTVTHLGGFKHQILGEQSGKSLDISGGSAANGANVIIWPWTGSHNQSFLFTPTDNGYFRITPVHSGKCLDVEGISTADGTDVHQWDYLNAQNQQWKLEPAGSAQ